MNEIITLVAQGFIVLATIGITYMVVAGIGKGGE